MPSARLPGPTPYLMGMLLSGRLVVVVGGGRVAVRRLAALRQAGARVRVVAPAVHPDVRQLADLGALEWVERDYVRGDLTGAWYVLAATDDAEVNALVGADAADQQTFCVRADRAGEGTAWTPATGQADGLVVGVLAQDGPRRAASVRDLLLGVLTSLARRAA